MITNRAVLEQLRAREAPGPLAGQARETGRGLLCPLFAPRSPSQKTPDHNPWAIVLAGGEGERVRPLIQRWLGRARPKQYCTFVGTRSLLRHTLDRAGRLTRQDRLLILADRSHQTDAKSQIPENSGARLLLQPRKRGTAAGIFLPLTYICARDPDATVVVYPSDHFVCPEAPLIESVRQAVQAANDFADRIVLLGVTPDGPEMEYGWIAPGEALSGDAGVYSVRRFIEKPSHTQAAAALASGAFWNTFLMVARLEVIWNLGWKHFPEMMSLFSILAGAIGTIREQAVLESIYRWMPVHDFSRHLLQRAAGQIALVKLDGVVWSDWGSPERILSTLLKIGRQPAFPLSCLP